MFVDPRDRPRQQICGVVGQLVDQPQRQRRGRTVGCATEQYLVERSAQPQQSHRTHHSTATGQQPEGDLGKTDANVGTVQRDSVMAGERQFEASPSALPLMAATTGTPNVSRRRSCALTPLAKSVS